MNLRSVLTTIFVLIVALAGTVWLGRGNEDLKPAKSTKPVDTTSADRPKISPKGPYPKAVVDEKLYLFGEMAVDQSRSHKFILKNEGEAPLEVMKGDTTCKCTLSSMKDSTIAPGESIEIELTWTPKSTQSVFGQTATIYTNDPENQELKLRIEGTVNNLIFINGSSEGSANWSLPAMSNTDPVSYTGKFHTNFLDEFKVLEITSSHPGLTTSVNPLTPEELKEARAKCGYSVKVTADPKSFPLGSFTEKLTIKTDIPDKKEAHPEAEHTHVDGHKHEDQGENKTFTVQVFGNHSGPIRIVPTFGVHWNPEKMVLRLGQFPAKEGKEVTLSMFVEGTQEPLKILDQKIVPEYLKVAIKKDDQFESKTKQRYELKLTVPPGIPAVAFGTGNHASVVLQTNHPDAKEIEFRIEFLAL